MQKKKTLKNSIIVRCIMFIAILSVLLSLVNWYGYRNALYQRYRDYITDLLKYAEFNINEDDLKQCVETGVKSEHFNELQLLFDSIKDTHNIDFIYVIIPLNTEPVDNVMNVIAGMSSYEKEYVPENAVVLGGLTGTDYSVESVTKYYNAINDTGEITFFEEYFDRWGSDYTGILPLYTSDGKFFAELCVDVPMTEIHSVIRSHVISNVLIIMAIGIIFIASFLLWATKSITDPIQTIEETVVDFANSSHGQKDPNALMIEMPEIKTQNELQSLSEAVVKLSHDMRDYLVNALSAQDEAKEAQKKAIEMSEQATKDALTGIRNRNSYETEVKKLEWRIQTEQFSKFGIAMVDLNYLKRINDTFGHEKGNEAIIKICGIVCRIFSHSPVFRIGGDEFVVILENEDYENVELRIKDFDGVLQKLKEDKSLQPWECVSAAIGWSMFDPIIDANVDNVFKRADHNMYENKKAMKAVRES